ncbi:MAG: hypothetical protein IPM20_05980 [Gammaproteobacteria bacterium]|nr:hypothetical protein [Gammaproteobacteria bacterium]
MIRVERALAMSLLAVTLSACAALNPHGNTQSTTTEAAQPPAPVMTPAETDVSAAHDAPVQPEPSTETPAPAAVRIAELLREAAAYGASSPEEQRTVLEEAETRRAHEQTPQALVRFALLQSLSEANRQADIDTSSRLLDLLAEPSMEGNDADLVPLTQLLAHILGERGRLAAQNAELTRKLNQLKAIEQQLGDRDGADMPPPAP